MGIGLPRVFLHRAVAYLNFFIFRKERAICGMRVAVRISTNNDELCWIVLFRPSSLAMPLNNASNRQGWSILSLEY
jgi:hypothetical protein